MMSDLNTAIWARLLRELQAAEQELSVIVESKAPDKDEALVNEAWKLVCQISSLITLLQAPPAPRRLVSKQSQMVQASDAVKAATDLLFRCREAAQFINDPGTVPNWVRLSRGPVEVMMRAAVIALYLLGSMLQASGQLDEAEGIVSQLPPGWERIIWPDNREQATTFRNVTISRTAEVLASDEEGVIALIPFPPLSGVHFQHFFGPTEILKEVIRAGDVLTVDLSFNDEEQVQHVVMIGKEPGHRTRALSEDGLPPPAASIYDAEALAIRDKAIGRALEAERNAWHARWERKAKSKL